jgi:hydrogenase maturation protease
MTDLREQLALCLTGRVCLMGLGNVDYGDDGFGMRLAEQLLATLPSLSMPRGQLGCAPGQANSSGGWCVVLAGTAPERTIGRVADEGFDQLVFLDAVDFGGAPGSVVFLDTRAMGLRFPQVSTHKISLGLLARWAEANGTTRAWLLGVQPESLRPGQPLTSTMRTSVDVLAKLLCGLAFPAQPKRPLGTQPGMKVNA